MKRCFIEDCRKLFKPKRSRQIYCGPECGDKARAIRDKARADKAKQKKKCKAPMCTTEFTPKTRTDKYCSPKCVKRVRCDAELARQQRPEVKAARVEAARKRKENPEPAELKTLYPEFYALVRPKVKAKTRTCLKCSRRFEGAEYRICAACHAVNGRVSHMAANRFEVPDSVHMGYKYA